MCLANISEKDNIKIIEDIVIENNNIEVVINTFLGLILLDIILAITTGNDNWVIFIKNTIAGFINVYIPVASIPTTLVVVTFAIVATNFTMILILIKEIKDFVNVLFFKNNHPFLLKISKKNGIFLIGHFIVPFYHL